MFYIYILYSLKAEKYYVGYTNDPKRRLIEHNTNPHNSFTANYRPWELQALFSISTERGEAVRIERYIKKQKSKALLTLLCKPDFVPTGFLAQLVRVPHLRD